MKTLFNDGWEFTKLRPGSDIPGPDEARFERVNLPHDWLIYQTGNLYEDSTGFYRKRFDLKKKPGRRYEIYFEGVYMDTALYVNGKAAGEWKYGYSSFFFDITELLKEGDNEIIVKVSFLSPNSRWYSGAGIFRDVWFIEHRSTHIVTDSMYISAKPVVSAGEKITADTDLTGEWEVKVSAELVNGKADCSWNGDYDKNGVGKLSPRLKATLWFPMLGKSHSALIGAVTAQEYPSGVTRIEFTEKIEKPELWSPENPKLYDCRLSVFDPEEDYEDTESSLVKPASEDSEEEKKKIVLAPGTPKGEGDERLFGFRSFTFDTDKGFFVNGVHTKINGVCEHHDLGALGAAFNKAAMRRKLQILRTMGVNAIRTSHNMPAVGLLELTDEMGFFVCDESFDMWEGSKTEYDYARFFKEWQERDVRSWIRRDRNHPSIFIWSIGNEIYDTHKDAHGQDITRCLQKEAKENDPLGNAIISIGSNYMAWEGAQKCADILKYAGYNYGEKLYDEHHREHPDWYIFGSETSSTVQSRGIYRFPYKRSTLADDDLQCSSLGNSTTSWGAPNAEYSIIAERDHDFSMGQFLWSGFDYIGEPTPYHTRNSYFGQIDTAGFPKDTFYIYKSAWTDAKKDPFVHVFPYWDFNEGQTVDVRVASNAPVVELFVNGESLGRKAIDHVSGKVLTGDYITQYRAGEITAVAYDESGKEIARQTRHSFGDSAHLVLNVYEPERKLTAGIGDMAFIEVYATDKDGYPVENATDLVNVKVEGAGYLAGLDNGDSADDAEYKGSFKRLFSGKMLICAAVGNETGKIKVTASAEGLEGAEVTLEVSEKKDIEGMSLLPERFSEKKDGEDTGSDLKDRSETKAGSREVKERRINGVRVRKIALSCDEERVLTPDYVKIKVNARILPEAAAGAVDPDELIWKAVDEAGIDSNIAKIVETEGFSATVKALGDGYFKIRCMTKCGCESVKVISELGFTAEGIGQALLDPYGFIAGGLYTYSDSELGNGNEHGIATQRGDRTVFGYDDIDFGSYGSDEITIPLFVLSGGKFPMQIWEGLPDAKGSEMLADVVYEKPALWNEYQSETYKLGHRVKGVSSLYFVTYDKAQFAGFSFKKLEKAYELLNAGECDAVYGDSFEKKADRIDNIGNNVTVEFKDMDFGDKAAGRLEITGVSHIPVNTIHVLFDNGTDSKRDIIEFKAGAGEKQPSAGSGNAPEKQVFEVSGYTGKGDVKFIFLPGSSFDLVSIRFI